jgi:hypothetical protein
MSTQIVESEFEILLRGFNETVKDMPPVKKVEKELLELRATAVISHELNFRQRDAITARVDNYINGEYGSNLKKTEYSQNESIKKK